MGASELHSTHTAKQQELDTANEKSNELQSQLAEKQTELEQCQNQSAALQQEQASPSDTAVAVSQKVMEGCTRVGEGSVNTTGFSIVSRKNLAVMGQDMDSRTCVLRGVVKFTSDGGTATAWLDPNYRDPATEMPLCFPVSGTMQFFASIVNPKDTSEIERTVGLQIEPHGRLVVLGDQPSDVM